MNGSSKQTSQRTYLSFFLFHNHARLNQWIEFLSPQSPSEFTNLRQLLKGVSMGLTDRRKTAKNLVDSRKNWNFLTVSRK